MRKICDGLVNPGAATAQRSGNSGGTAKGFGGVLRFGFIFEHFFFYFSGCDIFWRIFCLIPFGLAKRGLLRDQLDEFFRL